MFLVCMSKFRCVNDGIVWAKEREKYGYENGDSNGCAKGNPESVGLELRTISYKEFLWHKHSHDAY